MLKPVPRDDNWLLQRFGFIWSKYFADVAQINPVFVKFGRYSKLRLGSIKLNRKSGKSLITITSMFKDQSIPVEVVDHTLAHELIHYTHGFSSIITRLHKYPHAGGVVNQEMKKRGMANLVESYKRWMKQYRKKFQSL